MPLSELYRSVNGKNESPQQKTTDISYIPNDEFMELVWEKGQIMMQGQSSKAKKTPVSSNFQFQTSKVQEKEGLLDVTIPGNSVEMGLNQDDDMVPWLNYPLDDYCSDLLPEVSGVTTNEPSMHKASSSSRTGHLISWSLDPTQTVRSGVSDIGSSSSRSKPHNVIHRDAVQNQMVQNQKQDSLLPESSSGLLNFSHFSRPAAMARANLQNNGLLASLGSCGLDMVKNLEHHAAINVVNHGPQKEKGLPSKPLEEPHCVSTNSDKPPNVVLDANVPKGGTDAEPIGASSSVCSGNSAERASNDLTKSLKRKSRDTEDFECQSEDIEEESLGTKTAASSRGGTGSKRSRAAEVHNLSERRRRDRINEKMRALQELIPNCNKVDKASMLDEAIEYLKTLQLQVQIMSMGTGLCMPPMMFPTGMQHMHHPPHVPRFSPMGMSYGMGMNYGMGMGMGEMNGGSQGHPHMFPVPSQPISGLQSYGHPGQGMPMLFPQPPMPRFSTNAAVRHMEGQTSKDPMQTNPHIMTQTSSQCQVANKSLDQSTLVDKTDQVPEAGCNTGGID